MKEARQWEIIVQRGRPCERNPSETMNVPRVEQLDLGRYRRFEAQLASNR